MFIKKIILISCVMLVAFTSATEVNRCKGNPNKVEASDVTVGKCEEPTCIFRRRTTVGIDLKVRPEKDINELNTRVSGIILEVPLPFIGVDGYSACDNIYSEDGKTKLGCPMKAGETYLYKNAFKIHQIYPPVPVVVHWALSTPDNEDIVCFELPSRIK